MKTIAMVTVALVLSSVASWSQFKSKGESSPKVGESLFRTDDGGLLFGWFDPSRLDMHHSFSLSYASFGGKGISLGVYTNSLSYKFSEAWSLQTDISLVNSPFNSFGDKFGKDISGLYLSRAQLNYRPSEHTLFQIQFQQIPTASMYSGFGMGGFLSTPISHEEQQH